MTAAVADGSPQRPGDRQPPVPVTDTPQTALLAGYWHGHVDRNAREEELVDVVYARVLRDRGRLPSVEDVIDCVNRLL